MPVPRLYLPDLWLQEQMAEGDDHDGGNNQICCFITWIGSTHLFRSIMNLPDCQQESISYLHRKTYDLA
jgi:hypothetical protein